MTDLRTLAVVALLAGTGGCQLVPSKGRDLASEIASEARELRRSDKTDHIFVYRYPDPERPYTVEIHPCFDPERLEERDINVCGGLSVRSGASGTTSVAHLKEVLVPARLLVEKAAGDPTEITLRRQGRFIIVLAFR